MGSRRAIGFGAFHDDVSYFREYCGVKLLNFDENGVVSDLKTENRELSVEVSKSDKEF